MPLTKDLSESNLHKYQCQKIILMLLYSLTTLRCQWLDFFEILTKTIRPFLVLPCNWECQNLHMICHLRLIKYKGSLSLSSLNLEILNYLAEDHVQYFKYCQEGKKGLHRVGPSTLLTVMHTLNGWFSCGLETGFWLFTVYYFVLLRSCKY